MGRIPPHARAPGQAVCPGPGEPGFEAINDDQLDAFFSGVEPGTGGILKQPILFDFDPADKTMLTEVQPLLAEYGYQVTLFFHTDPRPTPAWPAKA